MEWMTMWHCAADVEQHGRSIRTSVSVKTSSVIHAGCTELWSSSTGQRSASPGKVSLIRSLSLFQSLTASQSYLALDPVDTLTAPTQTMS
jgi:hypothetical protein